MIAVLAAVVGGCHDGGAEIPDAERSCWYIEGTSPEGRAEIGTGVSGVSGFAALPPSLELMYGVQGGMQLIVNARMQGLDPGNPNDFLEPNNPQTRFSGVMSDGTPIIPKCPLRYGYKATLDGWYELGASALFEFLPLELGVKAFDTDMTLIVEVVDAHGRYARNEGIVTIRRPAGFPAR